MAKCPGVNCKMDWQWDWEMDHYRDKKSGEWCFQTKDLTYKSKQDGIKEITISIFICSKCKTVISTQVNDPNFGVEIFNHPLWGRLDWQSKAHSYPNQ